MRTFGKPWSVMVLCALAVLGAGELATRFIAPALPQPSLWYDDFTRLKVAQMEQLADSGGSEVVFAGTSTTGYAVDPVIFSAHDDRHRSAYNASLHGAYPEIMRLWLLEQVVPRLEPGLVVIGLNSFDLFGTGLEDEHLAAYRRAPMLRRDLIGALERALGRLSYLFRYRRALRDPGVLARALRDRLAGRRRDPALAAATFGVPASPDDLGPRGEDALALSDGYEIPERIYRGAQERWGGSFEPARDQFTALRSLVPELRARGIEVIFFELPTTPDYDLLQPHGVADTARFRAALAGLAAELGVELLRPPERLRAPELFFDPHHMNPAGRAAFSAWLAEHLPAPAY